MPSAVPFREAHSLICGAILPLPVERVSLAHATGRPLAETLFSPIDIPPVRNSAMDGYALPDDGSGTEGYPLPPPLSPFQGAREFAETFTPPAGERGARFSAGGSLQRVSGSVSLAPPSGERGGVKGASRVLTGHPVPDWAVCVAAEEHCEVRDGRVFPRSVYGNGVNIRQAGEDQHRGDLLASEGAILDAARLGRLASAGFARVRVRRRPHVLVLTSGDELVRPPAAPDPTAPRFESDAALITALLQDAGARVRVLPHLPDRPERFREVLLRLPPHDLLISCGGAANSEADHSRPVLRELGAEFLFERVHMKPGRPTAFGLWNGRGVFCLPGNPVAVFVTFLTLVVPALSVMSGRAVVEQSGLYARLVADLPADGRRQLFHRVRLRAREDGLSAAVYPDSGSGLIRSLVETDALVAQEPDVSFTAGQMVPVFWARQLRLPFDGN